MSITDSGLTAHSSRTPAVIMKACLLVSALTADQRMTVGGTELLYLVIAAVFLLLAARFTRRALASIGTLVQTLAAAAVAAFALGIAVALLAVAALSGH